MTKLNRDWASLAAKSSEMNAPEGTVYVGRGDGNIALSDFFDTLKLFTSDGENKARGLLGSMDYFVEKKEWKAKTGLKYYVGEEVTVTDAKGNVGPGKVVDNLNNCCSVEVNFPHCCTGATESYLKYVWHFCGGKAEDYGLKIEFKGYKSPLDPQNKETEKEMKNICTKVIPSAAPLIEEMVGKRGFDWTFRDKEGYWALGEFRHGFDFGGGFQINLIVTKNEAVEVSLSEFIAALEKIPEKPQEIEFKEIRGLDIKISKDKIVAGCQTLNAAKILEIKKAVEAVRNPSVRVNLPDYSLTVDSKGLSVGADYKVSFEQFDKMIAELNKFN